VGATVTDIDITPTTSSSRYHNLKVNDVPMRSGAAYSAQLELGGNTFVITVTSPDGSVTQTYTLVVIRE